MDVRNRALAMRQAIIKTAEGKDRADFVKAAEAIVFFISGIVFSLAKVVGTGAPFGIAAVASAGGGLSGICCLTGAAIGYLISGGFEWGVRYIAAAVMVYTVSFALQETRIYQKKLFAPLVAAAVTLFTGLLSGFSRLSDISAVSLITLETVLAFGTCSFFCEAMSETEPVTELAELRRSSAILISIAIFVMSLSEIIVLGAVSVGRFSAIIFIMTAALRNGMVTGCYVGTAFGVVMDISQGGAPFYTMAYAFAGLISGIFNRSGRLVFVLSFVIANAICVACAWNDLAHTDALFEVFGASVIFMLLPSGFLNKAGALMQNDMGGSGESGLRRYVSRRVERLGSAYAGLYEIVRRNVEEPYNDADLSKIFDRAADAVCISCKEKNRCWNKEYVDTLSALNDAYAGIKKRGKMQISDIPAHFTDKCKTPEALVTAINSEVRASAYRKQFREALKESRDTVWGQYGDMAEILGTVSKELGSPNGADHLAERRLIRYLRTLDIDADVAVYRDMRGRLRAVIESGSLMQLYKDKDYLKKLSTVVGLRLCRPKTDALPEGKLVLMEAEPLAVSVGIAAMKKKGEKVSGDRGTYFKTEAGVLCVILSDGMGCGAEAAKESGEVIDILEKFLRAGIDPALAMKTLSSVMLLKAGDNWGFATVDLMCVDLFTGKTSFYKYGAAPSYVCSGKSVQRINCESFAPGLNPESGAPDVVSMRLKPGSTAVIASDGVIADDNDEWLKKLLKSSDGDMKALARSTLREAEKIYGKTDDMTVLTVMVESRA